MLKKLEKILKSYTGDVEISLTREQGLVADLGLNSLDLMSLVCELEDEFDVEIPDRAISDFKTVGDVIDFIERQLKM